MQGQRERKQRIKLVASDGSGYGAKYVPVLASNDYALNEGETSVFQRELGGASKDAFAVHKRRLTIAGRDYAHETTCLACYGDSKSSMLTSSKLLKPSKLLTCKLCPMAFHASCAHGLGCELSGGQLGGASFTCPHHACTVCSRKSAAGISCRGCARIGGLISSWSTARTPPGAWG